MELIESNAELDKKIIMELYMDAWPSVSPYCWDSASRNFHITIKDILNLNIGETLNLFSLDWNMFDLACDAKYNKPGSIIAPSEFFRHGYFWTFTKTALGIKGKLTCVQDPEDDQTEFYIEYKPNNWTPLVKGRIPLEDEQSFIQFGEQAGESWVAFPKNTRLGWRGPMIRVEDMDRCPYINWEN